MQVNDIERPELVDLLRNACSASRYEYDNLIKYGHAFFEENAEPYNPIIDIQLDTLDMRLDSTFLLGRGLSVESHKKKVKSIRKIARYLLESPQIEKIAIVYLKRLETKFKPYVELVLLIE